MNRAKKTGRDPKGKGVEALFEQEQAAKAAGGETKAERDARRKREKRKEQREAAAKFNAAVAPPMQMPDKFPPIEVPPVGEAKIGNRTVKVSFSGTLTPEGKRALNAALDQPAPVKLTLPALAKAFDEACAVTEWRQAELDAAVREQAKAKQALDQAINRRANGERA